ncbi:MAG: RNA polymerase sigma factor [Desulfobulbaceae bacterium]|nr:RNA polymerase sigma factor [Desulfobulbaceae bacterium]
MEKSDEEIISLVLDGRKHEYRHLIHRYQRQIYNLMFRYSRSGQDAADLTQDVFLRAFEKLDGFEPGRAFFPWLYTLAVNRANDWSRNCKRRNAHRQELIDNTPERAERCSGQERMLEHREELERLQRGLDLLGNETREILMLRFHHELSVKEVAEIFAISESAVKMRTARGLQLLQSLLAEDK